MKNNPQDERDWHARRIEEARKQAATSGRSEAQPAAPRGSPKAVSNRRKKSAQTGLANESRPGLGTRNDDPDPAHKPKERSAEGSQHGRPQASPHGYEEPRPEPREQTSDSLAHDEERSTGVSGHMGST